MVETGTLLTYVLVVLGLFLIPGPAVLMTLARAASGGRRIGIATGLGIAAGDLVHTIMATVGLSAILMTSALAFTIVKYIGVAYLIYLGISAFLEKTDRFDLPVVRPLTAAPAFRQALFAEVLNPKTALFFLAFLPQFVQPGGSAVLQLATLGFVFVVMSAAFTSLIAIGAGSVGAWLRRNPAVARWQGRVVGTIYLALGARLALQER
ncbi:Threonine/homoserine/homoserine lactone efflux protein [Nitratireductor aquibiodomus]|uniref:Threonine/homoserine/homoserine lactone efflux protein n=1 Tax=Nitratireductor aquibiodomus TaxID=204799 RepID=A0A1H4KQ82_9HYPH|nr:LysE family translocator [Nitratireductor aquibiodomus]SEB60690.1 Threonine/homoserine/homoserine lactone efflux protein [Nitratireductor aquibiodomus]